VAPQRCGIRASRLQVRGFGPRSSDSTLGVPRYRVRAPLRAVRHAGDNLRSGGQPDRGSLGQYACSADQHPGPATDQHAGASHQYARAADAHADSTDQHAGASHEHSSTADEYGGSPDEYTDSTYSYGGSSDEHTCSANQHAGPSDEYPDPTDEYTGATTSANQYADAPDEHAGSPAPSDQHGRAAYRDVCASGRYRCSRDLDAACRYEYDCAGR